MISRLRSGTQQHSISGEKTVNTLTRQPRKALRPTRAEEVTYQTCCEDHYVDPCEDHCDGEQEPTGEIGMKLVWTASLMLESGETRTSAESGEELLRHHAHL